MTNEITDEKDPDFYDHDHYLSDEEWKKVVSRADQIYLERVAAEVEKGGAGDYDPMGLTPRYVSFPNSPNAKSDDPLIKKQLFVIHTAECPLKIGYAASLTEWADGDSYNPRASWHRFVDPATVALFVPLNIIAWHAAGGNSRSIGYEQAGYASFTREQWLVPDGLRQLDLLAQQIVKDGLSKVGIQWLSDAEVKAVLDGNSTIVGLCTHEQVSRLSGRTSRTDPGRGYPKDVLLEFVDWYHPDTPRPGTVPAPTPVPVTKPTLRWAKTDVIAMQGLLEVTKDGRWGAGTDARMQAFRAVVYSGIPQTTAQIKIAQAIVDVTVDGSWGTKSKAAAVAYVKAFQKILKVTVDGNWGPGTDRAFVAFHREWRGR